MSDELHSWLVPWCRGSGLRSGLQIKAARAMLEWTRVRLANAAGVHPNAVAYWERAPLIPGTLPSGRQSWHETAVVGRIRKSLESAGICFIAEPAPGVALCARNK